MNKAGRLVVILLIGAGAIVAVAYAAGLSLADWRYFGQPRNVLVVDGQEVRIPLPDGPQTRQRPAVPVTTTGSYAFTFEEGGDGPTRYDPCRPLDWALNPANMPDGAEPLIHDAVADVSRASGLEFNYLGETTEPATFDRSLFDLQQPDQFAPLIVGWSDEEETPDLAGSVTGLGGSSAVNGAFGDERFLAGGVVIMDYEDVEELLESNRGTRLATAVIMHELAHVIGLAHVDDDTELMNAQNGMLITWGPGDLAGLAIAGNGPCQ